MSDLRAELAEGLDEAEWNWLMPHAQRDSLILINPELDILDVAMAIANDDTAKVQRWISESLITKPSQVQISNWNQEQSKRFNALIIQPYVLVQELS